MATKGRVLIADDDAEFLQITADVLDRNGYECLCVPDGLAARAAMSKQTFDVFLCDISMPGNEDLKLIHDLPSLVTGMPVILLTGYPSLDTAISSVHLSVMAYLVKPVNSKELIQWVERMVEYSRVCRSGNEVYERLNGWTGQIKNLREYLVQNPRTSQHFPVGSFISMTIGNMLGSILDLKGLVEGMSNQREAQDVCQFYKCPRLAAHRKAIEETIEVLEKTRNAFKSKDLSRLRQSLESFLQADEEA